MPRIYDPTRSCLHVRDWPAADQVLWADALGDGDDETRTCAAKWRPTTAQTNQEGYGRWVNHLTRTGVDLQTAAAERVTPAQVRLYAGELRGQDLAPQSVCNRISQLFCVMSVLAPDQEWGWLQRRANRLALIAEDQHEPKPLTMLTGDILDRALKAVRQVERDGLKPGMLPAIEYRNWLMLAILALMPLRRHNFSGMSDERNLNRCGKIWTAEIPAEDTKQNKKIKMPVPDVLHRHIEFYLDEVRPTLLAGRESDRFWISIFHTDMTDHSVYIAITNFTRRVFGEAINPHRFRHIAVSSLVIAAPEMLEAGRALLTQADTETTKDHYIIGQSLAASRDQADIIATLRRRLPGGAGDGRQR